jgi:dynein heavy chain
MKGWALDQSTLFTKVTSFADPKEVREKLASGCYVQGLFLEGAGWSREHGCLVPPVPKVLVQQLPILQVRPISCTHTHTHTHTHPPPHPHTHTHRHTHTHTHTHTHIV